ncbi:MAG: malate dehydrogenase [Flavobacteriales bacterium]|jgi:malate dehydrogenase|uniref:malate dehydrogenase n=1 Tax=Blattabacterium sp. (Mastotermes darwiniensis) TaxID=39768 RepID=UPI000231DF42|nr:malate dehydrogenase [Blattabacterium sp. (Mastotermes darwiniensis)]AER40351.1 malate dehydrogenase, NAD-dependent [Blattabacterium sp. (Mastotermes darwiniensis) str. MADAR]MDR1804928.1 malate dehydrogenase [Flavobacteriales bacterium]
MKITIIGAGNVGASCASLLANKGIVKEIILLDRKEKLAEGKSLDISQMLSIVGSNTKVLGVTNDYSKSENSEIIIITSGIPRKPGMSRDELVNTNAEIIHSVTNKSIHFSPKAKFIIVSNPLDVMTYVCYKTAKVDSSRVMGMAGILDSTRYRYFLSKELNCSPMDIQTLLLGGHGNTMVPLYRYTSISGIPIFELLSKEKNKIIIEKTKSGGEEIVNLLGTSAWMAPSVSVVKMVESILNDSKRILSCSVFLKGEYEFTDMCLGVPIVLGKSGMEKIIELQLNKEEINLLKKSANHIQSMIRGLNRINF